MQDALAQVLSYALGIWRHRWVALAAAWIIALAGWTFIARMPESYVANARIFVDNTSLLGPLMRGMTVTPNANDRIAMMSRTLLSRPNLERLARMTDLDLQVQTEAQRDAMIRRLQSSISLNATRGNNALYSISVTHPDRETARRITQSLITVFIETSTGSQISDNSQTQGFLNQQIAESEGRLVEAETRLADFQRNYVDMLPGERGTYFNHLRQARSNLDEARLQLRELENRRTELIRQLDGEEPVFIAGGTSSSSNSALDQRIQAMQVQLDGMLTRFTDRHPEIRYLQGLIAQLDEERELELEEASHAGTGVSSMASSPVYQGMRSLLAETQAQAAALQVRVAEYEQRVEDLESRVNQIPDVEAQLTQLDRDYNVIYRQHQQLLERRESARLSEDLQRNAGDVTFRVIDPPFVPLRPSQPNKPMLSAGVLVVALGGGGVLALLLTLLHPIVTDARMLAQSTGLPLLGSVTHNKPPSEVRRARVGLAAFMICLGALMLAFAAVVLAPGLVG